jgi:hypothetical protein
MSSILQRLNNLLELRVVVDDSDTLVKPNVIPVSITFLEEITKYIECLEKENRKD